MSRVATWCKKPSYAFSENTVGNVVDRQPPADAGFSTRCLVCGVCEFMEHLAKLRFAPLGSRANGRDLRAVSSALRQSADMASAGCSWTSVCLLAGKP